MRAVILTISSLFVACALPQQTTVSSYEHCIERDPDGRIARDESLIRLFRKETGYPRGRPGYVVDHIVPLCACGADRMHNLQWQRADSAKMKDREERAMCRGSWKRGVDG